MGRRKGPERGRKLGRWWVNDTQQPACLVCEGLDAVEDRNPLISGSKKRHTH